MPDPEPTPPPVIQPGQTVTVEPKNPFKSTALWGLLVLLASWLVRKYLPAEFRDTALAAVLEALGFIVGAAVVAYGRWKATRPLGLGPTTTVEVK